MAKLTNSLEVYLGQTSLTYYLSENFPAGSDAVFVYVNRHPTEKVVEAIRTEEAKGYFVNATPLRLSSWHAVMSYQGPIIKRQSVRPSSVLEVGPMGDLLAGIIQEQDCKSGL